MSLTIAPAEGYDSFVSVEDASDYVSRMGIAGWPLDVAEQESLLRRATQYIAVKYEPRSAYLDPVHKNIQAATVEAAVRAPNLWQDVEASAIVSETLGPMSTSYAEPKNDGQMRFPIIDNLMRGLGKRQREGVIMLARL